MPKREDISKVMIIGSGPIIIGQACEFDYSGAQACNIIYRNDIAGADDPTARRAQLVEAYEQQFNNPYFAASMGIIEEIIPPRDTRKKIIALLDALGNKKVTGLSKKHNNIPL